jgi:hypothetical protein
MGIEGQVRPGEMVGVLYAMHTYFMRREGTAVIILTTPTPDCYVVRTTLTKDTFGDAAFFKDTKALWRFVKQVGKPYKED